MSKISSKSSINSSINTQKQTDSNLETEREKKRAKGNERDRETEEPRHNSFFYQYLSFVTPHPHTGRRCRTCDPLSLSDSPDVCGCARVFSSRTSMPNLCFYNKSPITTPVVITLTMSDSTRDTDNPRLGRLQSQFSVKGVLSRHEETRSPSEN